MDTHRFGRAGVAAAILTLVPAPVATADGAHRRDDPQLVGRAVLPVETYAPGPPSGAGLVPAGQTETVINGVHFPTPSQPVEGLSAILAGRRPGEYLVMPDNGFGGKANSRDFLIRAYFMTPDFKTAKGGSGSVAVGDFIQFADPDGLIGFPIVREGTAERWLTGGDIDPESVLNSRRIEAMAITTDDPVRFIADAQALDDHRLVLIERDGGRGATATARPVKLLFGCDNNFPNTGRNPALADDSEFIVVKAPGLGGQHGRNER